MVNKHRKKQQVMDAKTRRKAETRRTSDVSRADRSSERQNEPGISEPQQHQTQHDQFKKPNTPPNTKTTRSTRSKSRRAAGESQSGNRESDGVFSRSTIRGRSSENGRVSVPSDSVEDEDSLYDKVKNAQSNLDVIVDEWIEKYKVDREEALVILMQFFINASGCNGDITLEMLEDFNQVTIVQNMNTKFDEECGEYPIIMPGQRGKEFRANFCEFIEALVRQCQYTILCDKYLMEHIIPILIEMSDSEVRAFRHTATLAVMKLGTALVDVTTRLSANLETALRQYDTESQKARGNKSLARLEDLNSKKIELGRNMDEVKEMFNIAVKNVVQYRYKDISPQIRMVCVEEIGVWINEKQRSFFESYLKYIGWLLNDEVAEVRLKCLMALQPLYSSEESIIKFNLFTKFFKKRIYAMTLDKDYNVVVQAIKLITIFSKCDINEESYFTYEEYENVCKLVYSQHRAVAVAAGEFLTEYLLQPNELEAVIGQKTKRGKQRLLNTPLILHLVTFFIKSALPEHGAYLVDALIDTNPIMKDWECMIDLLGEEAGPGEKDLQRHEELALIELMFYCIKQTVTGEVPIGREHIHKNPSARDVKKMQSDKRKISEHFVRTLPSILKRHSDDFKKLEKLLAIPQYFDLDVYIECRLEHKLDLLLNVMRKIYMLATSTEVLTVAAKTFELLCIEEHVIYDKCNLVRMTVIDSIMMQFMDNIGRYRELIDEGVQPSEEEAFNMEQILKQISIFYRCHNMTSHDIWDSLYLIIKSANYPSRCMPYEIIKLSIGASFFTIMWSLHNLTKAMDSGTIDKIACNLLKKRLHEFMELLQYLLECDCSREGPSDNKWGDAYNAICDLLVVFCNQIRTEPNSVLHQLIYEADPDLQNVLKRWLQKYVLIEDNKDAQEEELSAKTLRMRRHFLAGYCRLLQYKMLPIKAGFVVFKNYAKYQDIYGDLIKATLGKLRDTNRTDFALIILQTLITSYTDMINEKGAANFHVLQKLAQKFVLLFGVNAAKNRDAITTLHKQGVLFAMKTLDAETYPNLPFLEVLSEFTNRLIKQDKIALLNYLDGQQQSGSPKNKASQPLTLYRNSLLGRISPVTDGQSLSIGEDQDAELQEDGDRGKQKKKRRLSKTRKGKGRLGKPLRKTPLPVTKTPIQKKVDFSHLNESINTPPSSKSPEPVIEDKSPSTKSEGDRSSLEINLLEFLSPPLPRRADAEAVKTPVFETLENV